MTREAEPSYRELESRLQRSESIIEALRRQEVDAIIGDQDIAYVRLKQMEDALRQKQEELERQVEVHAKDLGQAGQRLRQALAEQKRLHQQLQEYAHRLWAQAELLDLAYNMIYMHDMDGKIAFWNRGAEEAYGWKRTEAVGKRVGDLMQPEYGQPYIQIIGCLIRNGRWEGQLTNTARDGRKIVVASRWALRTDAQKRPEAILQIESDIAENADT